MVRLTDCKTCTGEKGQHHYYLALKVKDREGKAPKIWRWDNHKRLTVKFLDGDDAVHNLVKTYVKEWEACTSLEFDFDHSDQNVDIHISFYDDAECKTLNIDPGHWSYVGTDCSGIEQDEPTMNLDIKSYMRNPTMPENSTEMKAVILHEFGHAMGFIHEHLRKEWVEKLDAKKVLENYRQSQGWDDEKIENNVLKPLEVDPESSSEFDTKSIMMYSFSKDEDGAPFDVKENVELSELDKEWAARIYPK